MRELHLFAGVGGGIYGGMLLDHVCVAAVEIDEFCQEVLLQRQKDGWLPKFDIHGDLCTLNGKDFTGKFDILCGGFPCQAFSTAAHGKNIADKDLWGEMLRFIKESEAPIVFAENVTRKAIRNAKLALESIGYRVECCVLGDGDLGADHQRNRFWLLAYSNNHGKLFSTLYDETQRLPKFCGRFWASNPDKCGVADGVSNRRKRLKAVGNAQSPIVAATAFRVLTARLGNRRTEKVGQF